MSLEVKAGVRVGVILLKSMLFVNTPSL